MTQALQKSITFEEFVQWKPNDGRFELHDGVIVEMPQPLGGHEEITGFITLWLSFQILSNNLPYIIPKQALVKPPDSESGYIPDVLLLNSDNLKCEILWEKESTATQADSIPLVVEVVSTNWRDDYYKKFADYEAIGIPEYWIVDYLALAARKFIGNPQQPTISIYNWVDGEYQVNQFRGNDRLISQIFPELNLTVEQIFTSARK
jgi:Uma2 family endonuclease